MIFLTMMVLLAEDELSTVTDSYFFDAYKSTDKKTREIMKEAKVLCQIMIHTSIFYDI